MELIMEFTAMAGLALAVCRLICRAPGVMKFRRRLADIGRRYAEPPNTLEWRSGYTAQEIRWNSKRAYGML